jgi:hypothetical protein
LSLVLRSVVAQGLDIRIDFAQGKKWARKLAPTASSDSTHEEKTVAVSASTGQLILAAQEEGEALLTHNGNDASGHGHLSSANSAAASAEAPPAADGLDPATRTLKNVLLSLPDPDPELSSLSGGAASAMPPEELKALLERVWARRQEELRALQESFVTEGHQMEGLLDRLGKEVSAYRAAATAGGAGNVTASGVASHPSSAASAPSSAALVTMLEDIEFHVAQLHNALDFATMGGIERLLPLLDGSSYSDEIVSATAWALGTAVKYAPRVQEVALRGGAVEALTLAFRSSLAAADAGGGTQHFKVAAKALYAIGGLLRLNPPAQARFTALGGWGLVNICLDGSSFLPRSCSVAGSSKGPEGRLARALTSKAVTLIADLGLEIPRSPLPPSTCASLAAAQVACLASSKAVLAAEQSSSELAHKEGWAQLEAAFLSLDETRERNENFCIAQS